MNTTKLLILAAIGGIAAWLFLRKPSKHAAPSAVASSTGTASTPSQYSGLLGSGQTRTGNQNVWNDLLKTGIASVLGAVGGSKGNKSPFNVGAGTAAQGGRNVQSDTSKPDSPNPPNESPSEGVNAGYSPDGEYLAGIASESFPGSQLGPDFAGELGLSGGDSSGFSNNFDFSGGDAVDVGASADYGNELN